MNTEKNATDNNYDEYIALSETNGYSANYEATQN